MSLHRSKKLNPKRLVVVVAERIPLVQQLTEAISRFTDLNLFPLYSESRTKKNLEKIRVGVFDGLVVTAGLLIEHLNCAEPVFSIKDFSLMVFDECHHVTGDHSYSKVLELVAKVNRKERPLLLG